MRAAIITISSSRSEQGQDDESGPALAEFARALGAEIAGTEIVPDERPQIEWALRHYCDTERCELVLTTGGTGFSPSDVTPEATKAILDREAPGIAEALRAGAAELTPGAGLTGATLDEAGAAVPVAWLHPAKRHAAMAKIPTLTQRSSPHFPAACPPSAAHDRSSAARRPDR